MPQLNLSSSFIVCKGCPHQVFWSAKHDQFLWGQTKIAIITILLFTTCTVIKFTLSVLKNDSQMTAKLNDSCRAYTFRNYSLNINYFDCENLLWLRDLVSRYYLFCSVMNEDFKPCKLLVVFSALQFIWSSVCLTIC